MRFLEGAEIAGGIAVIANGGAAELDRAEEQDANRLNDFVDARYQCS